MMAKQMQRAPGSAGIRTHTQHRAACIGRATAASTSLHVKQAQPEEYWTCADIHCRVFLDRHGHRSDSEKRSSRPATGLDALKARWDAFQQALQRVDSVLATQFNDSLASSGHGRSALLIAQNGNNSTQSSQSQQAPGSSEGDNVDTDIREATKFVRNLVAPPVRPGVGLTAEDRGWVAVATLDSFGDKVPPRMLDAMTTGAIGTVKRDGIAYISNVAVLPSARRQGIAKRMVQEAEQLATKWGCRAVGLHCNPNNTAAMRLYLSMGYRLTKIYEDPWMPWLMGRGDQGRCLFMIKRLPQSATSTVSI